MSASEPIDDVSDEEPERSLGPLYDLKKKSASLADPDDASMTATFVATWLFCVATGGLGASMGWWSVAEFLFGAVGGGFLGSVAAIFVGALVSSIVPGRWGFALGQASSLLAILVGVHLMGGDPASALLLLPLPLCAYPAVLVATHRNARRSLVDAGIDADLVRELSELPDDLERRVHTVLDAAVTDYCEIHQVLKTSATSDTTIEADEIRSSAQAVLAAMLDRAAAVSHLASRAEHVSLKSPVRRAAAQALSGLESRARCLHDTAVSLMVHVAQLDDSSRSQLQGHLEHLERLDAAMAELPTLE